MKDGLKGIIESGRAPGVHGLLPIESLGRGCALSQVKEFEDNAAKYGVPTKFTGGIAHFENSKHMNEYDKTFGLKNIS